MNTWRVDDIGDQSGRTALITGPSPGGLGFHTALQLARHGAHVVLAGRNQAKVRTSADEIRAEVPGAEVSELELDLADLTAVRRSAAEAARFGDLHLLINNAGIMAPPHRLTPDGFESQFATNHLGPFLLTGLLLPQLAAAGGARIVTVSSLLHRIARKAPLGDPRTSRRYSRWPAYGESKLANLLFTFEADRRLREAGIPVQALAAHPGIAATHLAANGQAGPGRALRASILDASIKAVSQSASAGARPTLMAATADLPGGTYVGPRGRGELGGAPRVVGSTRLARDELAQRRLWELSQEAVGLAWP